MGIFIPCQKMEKLSLKESKSFAQVQVVYNGQSWIQRQNHLTPKPWHFLMCHDALFSRGNEHNLGFPYSSLGYGHPHLLKSYPSFKTYLNPDLFHNNNTSSHSLSAYIQGAIISALHALSHLILIASLRDGYYYYTHFTDEETEAQEE